MERNERRLIGGLRRGDPASYAALVDSYGPRVRTLSRRYVVSEADADDLTQEVFVALFQALPTFRGDSSLSTFVFRIALNHGLKWRARQRPMGLALDGLALASPLPGPEQTAVRGELAETIEGALADLSAEHQEVVLLHELQGLTYAECAAVLGVPVGTVKSRLFHAFRRLRGRLSGYVEPAPASALSEAAR